MVVRYGIEFRVCIYEFGIKHGPIMLKLCLKFVGSSSKLEKVSKVRTYIYQQNYVRRVHRQPRGCTTHNPRFFFREF